eukprot:CAMPEP_0118947072 /NCGR_PEP_ID=MMETSP1169-20130426/45321_1 /TAXON_ID=36882 /ORGANISM="Pyramimonas obovata, Strain CCMP722" /LENGTH=63 /DNA_ID=CAMNT_0006893207 /DNA_START=29 /DNA_END=221 /DNA_ORIENTATION=+
MDWVLTSVSVWCEEAGGRGPPGGCTKASGFSVARQAPAECLAVVAPSGRRMSSPPAPPDVLQK